MKQEVSTPVIIGVAVAALAAVIAISLYLMNAKRQAELTPIGAAGAPPSAPADGPFKSEMKNGREFPAAQMSNQKL